MGDSGKTKGDLSWADLLRKLREVEFGSVPDGWKTRREIADETGKSVSCTSNLLRTATFGGTIEMKAFSIDVGPRNYPVPHYRIAK